MCVQLGVAAFAGFERRIEALQNLGCEVLRERW
jgi:hypothetical protein